MMEKVNNLLYRLPTNPSASPAKDPLVRMNKKASKVDERLVRRTLARVWTRVMEDYARPGAHIPSAAEVRRELIDKGLAAASKAVADQHWFVSRSMVEGQIRGRVENGLNQFDLESFLKEVRDAQTHPEKIPHLRNQMEHYILNC